MRAITMTNSLTALDIVQVATFRKFLVSSLRAFSNAFPGNLIFTSDTHQTNRYGDNNRSTSICVESISIKCAVAR